MSVTHPSPKLLPGNTSTGRNAQHAPQRHFKAPVSDPGTMPSTYSSGMASTPGCHQITFFNLLLGLGGGVNGPDFPG